MQIAGVTLLKKIEECTSAVVTAVDDICATFAPYPTATASFLILLHHFHIATFFILLHCYPHWALRYRTMLIPFLTEAVISS